MGRGKTRPPGEQCPPRPVAAAAGRSLQAPPQGAGHSQAAIINHFPALAAHGEGAGHAHPVCAVRAPQPRNTKCQLPNELPLRGMSGNGGARPRARQTRDLQGQGQAEPCGTLFPSATSVVAGQRPGSGSRAPQPSPSVLRSDPASCLQPWASAPPAVMGPGRLRGPPALPGLSFSVPERGDGRAAAGASILFSCGEHTDPRGPARWVSAAPEQGMCL